MPVVLYTIDVGVKIIVVGNRISTEDVDVSVAQLVERYGAVYVEISTELEDVILEA